MVQVRNSVFETNSSSTHSIGISPKSDYDRWACDESEVLPDNTLLDTVLCKFVKVSEVYDRVRLNGWCFSEEEFRKIFCSNDELPDYISNHADERISPWRVIRNRYRTKEFSSYDGASCVFCDIETCEYPTSNGTIVAVSCYKED